MSEKESVVAMEKVWTEKLFYVKICDLNITDDSGSMPKVLSSVANNLSVKNKNVYPAYL